MTPEIPTPRTDAAEIDISGAGVKVLTRYIRSDIARQLERELYAMRARTAKLELDLVQAEQDLKQAYLDTIRALGERNDERVLADMLAGELNWRVQVGGCGLEQGEQALAIWRGSRK